MDYHLKTKSLGLPRQIVKNQPLLVASVPQCLHLTIDAKQIKTSWMSRLVLVQKSGLQSSTPKVPILEGST